MIIFSFINDYIVSRAEPRGTVFWSDSRPMRVGQAGFEIHEFGILGFPPLLTLRWMIQNLEFLFGRILELRLRIKVKHILANWPARLESGLLKF